MKVFTP